jgi:hypothetical protein
VAAALTTSRPARAARLLVLALAVLVSTGPPVGAQDPSTTTTSLIEVPAQDIVPQPDVGEEPDDAGDRGGALQIAVLLLVVAAVAGAVVAVVTQSRRARARG